MRSCTCAEHGIRLSVTSILASLVCECESDTHCPSGLPRHFRSLIHYDVTDLNQLFKTVSSKRILDFVKDIGLYDSLLPSCELDLCLWSLIALWLWWFGVQAGGAGASHNACLHIDSLSFDDVIMLLTVFEMLCTVFLSVLQGCVFILIFYYTTLILSCCKILF